MVATCPSRTLHIATWHGPVAVTVLEEQGRPVRVLLQGLPHDIAPEGEAIARLITLLLQGTDAVQALERVVEALSGLGRFCPPARPALPHALAQALQVYLQERVG